MAKAARLNLAEGWKAVAQRARPRRFAPQGRAELRAVTTSPYRGASSTTNGSTQPDPSEASGQPQKKGNKISYKRQINNSFLEKRKKKWLFPFCLAEA
ncbi:hypothetical protein SapgrDRAFT_0707 [Saprospira grandis DSM 2844]|uniref:Uncharacterized protein n=1 Tax=Saprospira grandis DSM 2844 TaxID=694433 RepID=J1I194_9BACT|nr:hypothetical protein SapgrDRAFT_0707 [Saprospira grandis DSM 2844]